MVQQRKQTNTWDWKTGIAFEYRFISTIFFLICEKVPALPSMKQLYSMKTLLLVTCKVTFPKNSSMNQEALWFHSFWKWFLPMELMGESVLIFFIFFFDCDPLTPNDNSLRSTKSNWEKKKKAHCLKDDCAGVSVFTGSVVGFWESKRVKVHYFSLIFRVNCWSQVALRKKK